ncbi:MAG: glycosyltransferase [Lachnospiraceae bacterium]
MDALILSCGTGGGHNAAGMAVRDEMIRRGHNAVMMNPYSLSGEKVVRRIDNTYISLAQKAPAVFGAVYAAGEAYRRLPFRSPVYFINGKMTDHMQKFLDENHFDVILMPHLFPAEILTNMKAHGISIPKTMFIATDYACIPFTEESNCDAYVIPGEEFRREFETRGIPAEKIYPFGIPVHYTFSEPVSYEEAKKTLGLDSKKRYILVSGGSIGAGKIEKTLDFLIECFENDGAVQIIVICGSNRKLYERLNMLYAGKMIIIGHTDQMACFLRASDLYFTKPGGLSSTEAAVVGIPTLLLPGIPGCETHNSHYFTEKGMSREIDFSKENKESVIELMSNNSVRCEMVRQQQAIIHRDAAAKICKLAESMVYHT